MLNDKVQFIEGDQANYTTLFHNSFVITMTC